MSSTGKNLSDLVVQAFGYLESDYGFEGREASSQPFHYAFSAPHLIVSIWYGRNELDVLLERELHTSVLRPYHPRSYELAHLIRAQIPSLVNTMRAASFRNISRPTEEDIARLLGFFGKALRDHYDPLLRKDYKALEEYASKS